MTEEERDARRYRMLREIAVGCGDLEAAVALFQLDFCPNEEVFDTAVDKIIDRHLAGKMLL